MAPKSESVPVVGCGMVSSLGHDVVTGCAAARAGIVRPSELDTYLVANEEAQGESLIAHIVPWLTHGFEGMARQLRLLEGGLADLMRQTPNRPWCDARAGFFVSMPNPGRIQSGPKLIEDEDERREFEQEAASLSVPSPQQVAKELIDKACTLVDWEGPGLVQFVATSGATGVIEAVAQAQKTLASGALDFAIVVALDSWLDYDTLVWLERAGRLKTPDQPVGLSPGEACAVLVLESPRHARDRRAETLASIGQTQFGEDPMNLLAGESPTGRTLAEVIDTVRPGAGWGNSVRPWILSDHNGESYRAAEWGNALVHLVARSDVYQDIASWFPAASFGDTGAAAAGVAICVALRAFARGYALHDTAAIVASSDGPTKASILVHAPST